MELRKILNFVIKKSYSNNIIKIVLTSLIAAFACTGIIYAATTVGTNISTTGTLDVTGASTLTGNTAITGTLTVTGLTTLGNASTTLLSISSTGYIGGANGLILADGSITDASGSISFGNENLSTTGTLAAAGTTVSGNLSVSGNATTTGAFNVDGQTTLATTTLTGTFNQQTDQAQYVMMGQMQAVMTKCVAMFGWLNTGNGNTEINQCGNGIADTANNESATYSAHSTWDSARKTQGGAYYVDFDGTHTLSVSDDEDFTFASSTAAVDEDFSVGLWIRPEDIIDSQMIIGKYDSSNNKKEWLFWQQITGVFMFDIFDQTESDADRVESSSTYSTDTWYFIVVVYDSSLGVGGAGLRMYINGVYDAVGTNSTYVAMRTGLNAPVVIGDRTSASDPYQGDMGVMFITKEALTASQVASLYNISRAYYAK